MAELFTCRTCGCYFYSSDALNLGDGDYRELICYKKSFDGYAKACKKEKGKMFRNLVIHLLLLLVGFGLGYLAMYIPNEEFANIIESIATVCVSVGSIWTIVNIIKAVRNSRELLVVGIPAYEYETTTETKYADGHTEKTVEYSSDYSAEQYYRIGHNIGLFLVNIVTVGLFGWIKFIVYYVKYRKALSTYFELNSIIKSLKKNKFTYSTIQLCDVRNVNKKVSLTFFTDKKEIAEGKFIIKRHIVKDNTLYVLIEASNNYLYLVNVLPNRKAILITDEKKIDEILDIDPRINAIDQLLDENYTDNIILYNDNKEPVEFEQIAIIPYNDKTYAILKPVVEIPGVKDDEAFVFDLLIDEGNVKLVEDESIIDAVFDIYNQMENELE